MKKVVYSSSKDYSVVNPATKTIDIMDIMIVFNEEAYPTVDFDQVAAAKVIDPSISESDKLTTEAKKIHEDYITNIEDMIQFDYGFKILSSKQSGKSYAWYIEFEAPGDVQGQSAVWKVRIRIADHPPKDGKDVSVSFKNKSIFKSITIGENYEIKSAFEALGAIDKILEGISNNNFDVLFAPYSSNAFN